MSGSQEQLDRILGDADHPADAAAEEPLAPDLPPDRTKQFTHTSLSRMPTEWRGADRLQVEEALALATRMVRDEFREAFAIQERIKRHVRLPLVNAETGEVMVYSDGTPRWEVDELGMPVEDWGRLGDREREALLYTITTWMFQWEQAAADTWANAMLAKGVWEEKFARGFRAMPGHQVAGKPTVDDRTQFGHSYAIEERYFALFRSAISRKADAVVRSMRSLQRLLEGTVTR